MDLKERLADHWASELARTPVTDPGEIMNRGETLRRRRTITAGAVPILGLAVVVAAFVAFRGDPPAGLDVDSVAAQNAAINVENRTLDWSVVPATLGWSIERTSGDGITYVLSTAPGTRFEDFPDGNVPKAIYTSTDGQEWSPHPIGGSWVSSIAASGGLLYAVGTAPGAAADSVTVQVGVSSDQGDSFELVPLPFEENRPAIYRTQIAATDGGILALVEARISTDTFSLLPAEALNGAVEPVNTARGIAVFPATMVETAYNTCFGSDSAECQELIDTQATYFTTWEEVGVDPEDVVAGEIMHRAAYWSSDGAQYEEIDVPFPDGWIQQITRVEDESVIAIETPSSGTSLHASANGRDWRQIAEDVGPSSIAAIGTVQGQVAMVRQPMNDSDVSILRAPELDGPWEEVALDDALSELREAAFTWISSATVADSGIALVLQIETQQGGGGNAISQLIDRLFGPEGEEMEPGQETTVLQALLVTDNLVDWSLVPAHETGGFIDHMWFQPDGTLVAHTNGRQGNQPVRWQATATP